MDTLPPPVESKKGLTNTLNGNDSSGIRDGDRGDRLEKTPVFHEYSDRRNVPRLRVKLEVNLEFFDPSKARIASVAGTVTSLSEAGVTVVVPALISLPGNIYVELWSPNKSPLLKGAAEVRWMHALPLGRGFEYGLHFANISPPFDLPVRQYLSSLLTDKTANKDRRIKSTVHTEPFQLVNRHGRRIVGFIDRPVDSMTNTSDAFVVLPPAYGETKTGAVTIGYFFAVNGISAVRYDASDHVGESEGTILDCTLKKMQSDLTDVISHLRKTRGARRVALVASSLAARVAIKVVAEDDGIQFLGALVPVVNLQKTLAAVYNEDLIGGTIEGHRWGTINMLGFQINANDFLADAVRWHFHLPETTLEDFKKIKIPFCLIAGANDPWVNHSEIESLLNSTEGTLGEFILMNDAIHQLYENPSAVKETLKQIVMRVQKAFQLNGNDLPPLKDPNFREIALQSRLEKERLRFSSPASNTADDEGFWSSYLERFHFIIRIPEYRRFYEKIANMLGPIQPGDEILDAGCGNGSFGVWLLTNHFQENGQLPLKQFGPRFTYTGADLVPSALFSAQSTHSQILKNINVKGKENSPAYNYNIVDLNKPLPYLNGYFNKICCNLVISYLLNPRWVIGELVRVLKPEGHLVVSTLKPNPDLSLIYSSFVEEANSKEELEEARRLLNNASSILDKERQGQFKFMGENELSAMARELEVSNFNIERSFGNQANVIKIVK